MSWSAGFLSRCANLLYRANVSSPISSGLPSCLSHIIDLIYDALRYVPNNGIQTKLLVEKHAHEYPAEVRSSSTNYMESTLLIKNMDLNIVQSVPANDMEYKLLFKTECTKN